MIDAHAFLYFGDGQSIKFHSGRYKPDGGALMIGKEGIEGWWSAPNLKVDMVERSAGNGGHDVASDRILYASRTVTVHFDVVGDARGEILDTVMRLSRANGLPVKFRVVDDWSDTFVCGYIHDEYGAKWSARHQTGTLTIVCPRPERFSTVVQSAQLMPVARSRGGLSYGVPQYGLSWTGTADASTSQLSQNGNVVATNQIYSSNAYIPMNYLQEDNSGTWVGAPAPIADGSHYRYTVSDNIKAAAINPGWSNIPAGQILVVGTDANADRLGMENATMISSTPTMSVWETLAGVNHSIYLSGAYGARLNAGESLTLTKLARFAPDDWQTLQALGVDWFSGSAQNPPANSGLSYGPGNKGLSYGVTADGGERNLTALSNHGSYPAYPTLVVNGPFPDGVEIQTGVGGSIRYSGAVGMVPLTIQCDPRNVAASMGGVDVGRYLVGRDLPSIPSGGSLSLRLVTAGSGWVTCSVHDTYL